MKRKSLLVRRKPLRAHRRLTRKKAGKRRSSGIRMTAADIRWAAFIKKRDGYRCAYCRAYYGPKHRGLQAAHIFGRSIPATHTDPDNGVSLCYGHHRGWAHKYPLEFHQWVREVYLGPERYDALKERAKRPDRRLDVAKEGG